MIEDVEGLRWLEWGVWRGDAVMYLVQIINKPHQVVTLKVWRTSYILLPVEYGAELVVEVGRVPVEMIELLQGRETG